MPLQGVTEAEIEVNQKTNEIPELARLLAPMNLQGRVITADAMHTQKETARFIVEEKSADYLFTVKEHQKTLHAEIATLGDEGFSPSAHHNGYKNITAAIRRMAANRRRAFCLLGLRY